MGRISYLSAQRKVIQEKLYVADLIWSIAKTNYTTEFPMPSDLWENKPKDNRSAAQIIDDLINGLGGE